MIIFVRHGETDHNRARLLLGRADPPLTEHGSQQATLAARAVARMSPVRIVSSPLLRARQTADAIAAVTGHSVEIDERLIELDYGTWEGTPLSDADAERVERWKRDSSFAPPEGESLDAVGLRVAAFCLEVAEREAAAVAENMPLVAVSHVSPIKAATAWALGVGPGVAWRMFLGLASITKVAMGPEGPHLLGFNDTAHLDGEEQAPNPGGPRPSLG